MSPDLRGDSGPGDVAEAGSARPDAAGVAGAAGAAAAGADRVTLGAGEGAAAGVGTGVGVAGAAAGAGANAALNITPQCTQNFAFGWFSLPQAVHFIDASSLGNLCRGSKQEPRTGDPLENPSRPTCATQRSLLSPDRRAPVTPRGGP